MSPPIDFTTLPPIAQRVLAPDAPENLRLGAARGILPGLKPGDIVTVVALFAESGDPDLAPIATQTLTSFPTALLNVALDTALPAYTLDVLARTYWGHDDILGRIVSAPNVAADTVADLAESGSELLCERIAINEERLLEFPVIIEKLYMNRQVRMSTADRVLEFAVRNELELNIPAFKEASLAIQDELVAEATAEPNPDDLLYAETDRIAETIVIDASTEDTHELDEQGNEKVKEKIVPLWAQISNMTVSQKIRRAILGTPTERMLLVRDGNRLVASAAIRSPLLKENEVVQIAASRSVSDEVLRIIAGNKEWTQNHQVKFNLVSNPRTPFTFASRLISYLRDHELKILAKSKNVPQSVQNAARQHLTRKEKKAQG